jgi:hypothetical protein
MLKKAIHGLFQARKPKMGFPSCSQNQGFGKFILDFDRPSLGSAGCFSTACQDGQVHQHTPAAEWKATAKPDTAIQLSRVADRLIKAFLTFKGRIVDV